MDTEHFLFEEDSGLIIPTDGQYFRIYSSLEEWVGWIVQEPIDLRKSLIDAIMTNGLNENPERYSNYSPRNKGCSTDNPFVIEDSKHYVRLEYALIAFIFEWYPGRGEWIRLYQQNIIHKNPLLA